MQPTSRLETFLTDTRSMMKLRMLIADLRRQVGLLASDIHEEEKRTGIVDASDVAYPILAKNLSARRDNLLVTISLLESQLAGANLAA